MTTTGKVFVLKLGSWGILLLIAAIAVWLKPVSPDSATMALIANSFNTATIFEIPLIRGYYDGVPPTFPHFSTAYPPAFPALLWLTSTIVQVDPLKILPFVSAVIFVVGVIGWAKLLNVTIREIPGKYGLIALAVYAALDSSLLEIIGGGRSLILAWATLGWVLVATQNKVPNWGNALIIGSLSLCTVLARFEMAPIVGGFLIWWGLTYKSKLKVMVAGVVLLSGVLMWGMIVHEKTGVFFNSENKYSAVTVETGVPHLVWHDSGRLPLKSDSDLNKELWEKQRASYAVTNVRTFMKAPISWVLLWLGGLTLIIFLKTKPRASGLSLPLLMGLSALILELMLAVLPFHDSAYHLVSRTLIFVGILITLAKIGGIPAIPNTIYKHRIYGVSVLVLVSMGLLSSLIIATEKTQKLSKDLIYNRITPFKEISTLPIFKKAVKVATPEGAFLAYFNKNINSIYLPTGQNCISGTMQNWLLHYQPDYMITWKNFKVPPTWVLEHQTERLNVYKVPILEDLNANC